MRQQTFGVILDSNKEALLIISNNGVENNMRRLLCYLHHYKKETVIAPLFKMLEASFELFVPLVMASIIDTGIRTNNPSHIIKMGLILILLGIIGLTCSLTAQYFAAKASVGFGTELRRALFSHINTLSYTEIDTLGTSTLITRITSDINQIQSGVNLVLRLFLRSPFIVLGAMIMAFTVNVRAALVFVVAIPLLAVVVFGIMLVSIPLYQKVQSRLDEVLLITRENLTGARVIRSVCRQEQEKAAFAQANGTLVSMQTFVGKIAAFLNPVTYLIVNAALLLILYLGGLEVEGGSLTQGEVIALVNYMSQILIELVKLANLIITFTKSLACANRVNEIFDTRPGIPAPEAGTEDAFAATSDMPSAGTRAAASDMPDSDAASGEPLIAFRNVSFAYAGAKEPALSGISFAAKCGETIGIIGGTGSGKSTLVNLIPRFYDVSEGEVLYNGRSVASYPPAALRSRIGVVPQKAVLFAGTLRDNIKWGNAHADDAAIMQAVRTAQAEEIVASKAEGLDLMIKQGGSNLSGGQKQRFTIARALVRKPDILILDDSASALDFATDAALRKALRADTKDMTVFIVSQRATTVKDADRIIVLDDGQAVGIGTHSFLLETCEVYKEICLSQLSKEEVMQK